MKRILSAVLFCFLVSSVVFAAEGANPKVALDTSHGKIVIELYQDKAPVSVKNFLDYVDSGFYDSTVFHRVIKGFMIQGGGFTADITPKSGQKPAIKNEAGNGLKNLRGTLAMARTGVVDSATSQFFINSVDNAFLDHKNESVQGFGYAVFGKVIEGLDVVDKISSVPTATVKGFKDVPSQEVVIKKAERLK
ncbi:peptidyl-prolyl cis-trans isomerase [bacterium]|nr:MAG: peptidyl-prolyl cis-trans isomerase [bacterium]